MSDGQAFDHAMWYLDAAITVLQALTVVYACFILRMSWQWWKTWRR